MYGRVADKWFTSAKEVFFEQLRSEEKKPEYLTSKRGDCKKYTHKTTVRQNYYLLNFEKEKVRFGTVHPIIYLNYFLKL